MAFDRLEGQELNDGQVATPREAATLILLRESADGHEVLLVQRNPAQRFMGGLWVFPGGARGAEDADLLATAVREMEEEAGIRLEDPDAPLFSRWITPEVVKIRFDASFFVAEAPAGAEARIDGNECVDVRWIRPADALAAFEREEMGLAFPTIKHLEELASFGSIADTLEAARGRTVEAILPVVSAGEESIDIQIRPQPER